MNCWIEINVVDAVSDYRYIYEISMNCWNEICVVYVDCSYAYVGHLWVDGLRIMMLKLSVIMKMLVNCVEYSY